MRLITRGDLDGAACAVLLGELEPLEEIVLAHPQDVVQGRVKATAGDIVANLPYAPGCGLWFDHRQMTPADPVPPEGFAGRHRLAASAVRVIWEHYGRPPAHRRLVEGVDRFDSAQLTEEEILHPTGYVLLGLTLDGRSGLGDFQYYFQRCVDWLGALPMEEVLVQPLVLNRAEKLSQEADRFVAALERCSRVEGRVVVTDFRHTLYPPAGNRFLVHSLFPETHAAIRLHWGPQRRHAVIAAAHSPLKRTCGVNLATLLAGYGGGGHFGAGTAPVAPDDADRVLAELVEALRGPRA